MSDSNAPQQANDAPPADRRHRWDALGVIIASLVGLLALLVSGYTAWIQRQQVRAEVWPHLMVAYQDSGDRLTVFNKGVGPAIVRSVRVTVDGKPQPDWDRVLGALGLPAANYRLSTITGTVLSPGDALSVVVFPDEPAYARFRKAMSAHGLMDICYCSTLDECWVFEDRQAPVNPVVRAVAQCERLPAAEAFRD